MIALPVFEHYGDRIEEWLSAIGDPSRAPVPRVTRSMRRTAAEVERVRNSARHRSLAEFIRHAANALDAAEWDGARYLLQTAHALMAVRSAPEGGWTGRAVRQLPLSARPGLADARIGIVTG